MKEQSGWAWNPITRLPNVDVEVMNDYIEVSDMLFLNLFRHLIFSQAHPKSKQYFTKPFPMYNMRALHIAAKDRDLISHFRK
jgi:hypothetical protein